MFELVQNLEVVLDLHDLYGRHRLFEVLFALLLARDGPGQIHLVHVAQYQL